jgi:hypothetical protein
VMGMSLLGLVRMRRLRTRARRVQVWWLQSWTRKSRQKEGPLSLGHRWGRRQRHFFLRRCPQLPRCVPPCCWCLSCMHPAPTFHVRVIWPKLSNLLAGHASIAVPRCPPHRQVSHQRGF